MNYSSSIALIISVFVILVIIKQYLTIWVFLDEIGLKLFKYILPISEIFLLVFADRLFLVPSVSIFLYLIYKKNILDNKIFLSYCKIDKNKFKLNKKLIILIILLSPAIFFISNDIYIRLLRLTKWINLKSFNVSNTYNNLYNKQIIDYLVIFSLICIVTPLIEEFTFRVLIYDNWLAKIFKRKIFAVIISTVVFGLSHFNNKSFIYTVLIGIILCFVYDLFGYLCCVILHMLLNIYTFFILYSDTLIEVKITILLSVISIIISIIFILTVMKKKDKINA